MEDLAETEVTGEQHVNPPVRGALPEITNT